jgi:hypothetical protein
MKLRVAAALVMLGVLAAGCGSSGNAGGAPEDEVDWTHPWHGQGVQVASAAHAQPSLPFQLRTPGGPDGLEGIFLPPQARPFQLMAVWFVFTSSKYGVVWIGESLPDVPDDQERLAGYQETVSNNGSPGAAQSEIVQVRRGDTALLGISPDGGGTLEWVESGVQFDVQGPTLSRADLVDIAAVV